MNRMRAKLNRKRILKLVLILIVVILFAFPSKTFAAHINLKEAAAIEISGVLSIVAWAIRAIFAIVWFALTLVVGASLNNALTTLSIEDYIFNKVDLTSLRVFVGSSGSADTAQFYEFVSRWFVTMMGVALAIQLLIFVYIIIVTIVKSIKQDPQRDSEVKIMFKDFILGVIVLVGMSVFVIGIISLNNLIVDILAKGTKVDTFRAATNAILLGVFDISIAVGTVNLILYIIITTMGLIFFVHYLKRLFKVSFLIVISPLVATTFAIDRRISGGATKLLGWSKMFIFAVFSQTIHALLYLSLVAVVIQSVRQSSTSLIPLVIISVSGLKFLWDSENIVSELFGMPIDKAQSNAGFMLGLIQTVGRLKSGKDTVVPKVAGLKENSLFKEVTKRTLSKPQLAEKATEKLGESMLKAKVADVVKETSVKRSSEFVNRLTELGAVVKESAEIKFKSYTKEKAIKTFSKAFGGAILATASHATPKVGMVVGATAGAAAGGAIHDAAKKKLDKNKYKGRGKEKTIEQEAGQLNAIADRKDFLEKAAKEREEKAKLNEEKEKKKVEETYKEETEKLEAEAKEEAEKEERKAKEEKDKKPEDKDKDEETKADEEATGKDSTGEYFTSEDVESYTKEIAEKSKKDIMDEYYIAKEDSIEKYMEENDVNKATAIEYVEELQKSLLKDKEFNYRTLNEADNILLNKYLDVITKQKIEVYEANTKEDEYNYVIQRTTELRRERTQKRLESKNEESEEEQEQEEQE